MSGKQKNKVYHYSAKGKYLKTFECENDLRKEYYLSDRGQRPIFNKVAHNNGKIYRYNNITTVLPDGSIASKERIGRIGVFEYIKRSNSSYVGISDKERLIDVINLDNKIIATFKGLYVAAKMTNISAATIHHQINKNSKHSQSDLIFRYK